MSSKFTAKVNKGREKLRASMDSHFKRLQEKKADPFAITAPEDTSNKDKDDRYYWSKQGHTRLDYHSRTGR